MLLLRFELGRELALDLAQGLLGLVQVSARIPDLGKIEPGAIAHARSAHPSVSSVWKRSPASLCIPSDRYSPPSSSCAFFLVVRDQVPVLVGREAGDRLEVLILEVIKEHVAVVQVADARDRQLLRVVAPRQPPGPLAVTVTASATEARIRDRERMNRGPIPSP